MFSPKVLVSIVMFLYYFIFIPIAFFISPHLHSLGVDIVTTGFLQAFGLILLIVTMLINGVLTDKYINNKRLLIVYLTISSICFVLFSFVENVNLLMIIFLLIWIFFMSLVPVIDGLVLIDIDSKDYHKVRAFGSIGAAFSYLLNGYLLGASLFNYMLLGCAFAIVMIVIILFKTNDNLIIDKINYKLGIKHLIKNSTLLLIFIITLFSYGVLGADDAFQYQYNVEIVLISSTIYGVVGFSSIFIEGGVMMGFNKINNFLSEKKMLHISCLLLLFIFMSKFLFFENKTIIIIGDLLLGVFVGLFIPTVIGIINREADDSIKNTVLSLYQMSIKLGAAFLGFTTAIYYEQTKELASIYYLHALFIIIPIVLIFFLPKSKYNE